MKKTRLETAAENLGQAALEFDEACNETYRIYYSNLYKRNDIRPSGKAQQGLQETVQDILRLGMYSAGQARAIKGVLSAWHPPQVSAARSFPVGRSGGAG